MNNTIGKAGAGIVILTVAAFAVCMLIPFNFGSYFVCTILPIGYLMMAAALCHESDDEHRTAANVGLVLAGVYMTLILIVYFAQNTTVRLESLGSDAMRILDFQQCGLLFNYDLLGYGIMALSTFFVGLSFRASDRADLWLKRLLMIHGVFFFGCLIMPMAGMFTAGKSDLGGVIALECWCAYFLPIGILAWKHFSR